MFTTEAIDFLQSRLFHSLRSPDCFTVFIVVLGVQEAFPLKWATSLTTDSNIPRNALIHMKFAFVNSGGG